MKLKKIVLLVLLFMVGLMITDSTYGSDLEVIKGVEFTINDPGGTEWELDYDEILDRLYIISTDSMYDSGSLSNGFTFSGQARGEYLLAQLGENIQAQSTGIEYTVYVEVELYIEDGEIISDYFNYLAIETNTGISYLKLDLEETLTITMEYVYILDEDGGVNIISDSYSKDFTINSLLFTYPTAIVEDWSNARIYLMDVRPNENNFLEFGSYDYWIGFDESTLKNGFYFTENYFFKYVEEYIEPYTNGDNDLLDDLRNEYITEVATNGITITLPPIYAIQIFFPGAFLDGVDYWTNINGEFTEINIKIPDLVYDGGEIWGDTLEYTLGETTYTYGLIDEFSATIPPIFGFRIASDFYLITFNSTGGSAVASQYVGYGGIIEYPGNPTRIGWEFLFWRLNNPYSDPSTYINPNQSYNTELEPLRGTESGFPRVYIGLPQITYEPSGIIYHLEDFNYYAVWRPQRIYINIILSGGSLLIDKSTLTTIYGDSANENIDNYNTSTLIARPGYSLVGWYIDEGLTTPFNFNAPLTENLSIYPKWQATNIGESSPSLLNQVLDSFGLFDNPGMFIVYVVLLVSMFVAFARMGAPNIIVFIGFFGLSALWIFLGWFTLWATIIIILLNILLFLIILKKGD